MDYSRLPDAGDGHRHYAVSENGKSIHPEDAAGYPEVRGAFITMPARPPATEHHVIVPEDAIANRMKLYGLATEGEAVEHIMWEHHIRLNPTTTPKAAGMPDSVKANFDRVFGPGHKPARGLPMSAEEVAQHQQRLEAIRNPREAK